MEITESAKIRIIRAALGFRVHEFAAKLGITTNTLNNWESGRTQPTGAKREAWNKLCREYGWGYLPSGMPVPMDDILAPRQQSDPLPSSTRFDNTSSKLTVLASSRS